MGAYRKGEIRDICQIVSPDMVVITAVSEQHLALFGDIRNTLQAKYEIVEYSKKDAKVVLNGDDDMVLRIAGKSNRKELLYSRKKELDLWASDIKSRGDRLEFNVNYKDKVSRFEVRVLGEYNVSNVLAATAVALEFGMDLEEISDALKKGSKKKKIGKLSFRRSKYRYTVIDDSYNSNPKGFEAALEVLRRSEYKRKILVTVGIIELGEKREEVYKRLAQKIVEVCDVLVTSDKDLVGSVRKEHKDFKIIFDKGIQKQLNFLKNKVNQKDLVLFEGPNARIMKEVVKGWLLLFCLIFVRLL